MPSDQPISCTLTSAEQKRRRKFIRAELLPRMTERQQDGRKHTLNFRASTINRHLLKQFIELERDCCGFLDFALQDRDDLLVLTVEEPDGADGLVAQWIGSLDASGASRANGSGASCGCCGTGAPANRKRSSLAGFCILAACGIACSAPVAFSLLV